MSDSDRTFPAPDSPACFFAPGIVGPVHYEGRQLWLAYRIPVSTGDRVHLLFERAELFPRQGLRVRLETRRHELEISEQRANGFTLWSDTAPRHVEVTIAKAGRGGTLVLKNVWEFDHEGSGLFGMNWTAMSVRTESDGTLLFDCSDGYGMGPSFGDLVVRVIHERVSAAPRASRASV